SGRERLDGELSAQTVLGIDRDRRVQSINRIQSAAGNALLTMAERSGDPDVQTEAFQAFAGSSWGASLPFSAGGVAARLRELAVRNPENVTMQSLVPKLVR